MATPRPRADCAHLTLGVTTPLPRLWAVIGLTGTFMVLEFVGGWVSGSLALLADAGHMLTDVGALGLTLLTAWIAQRDRKSTRLNSSLSQISYAVFCLKKKKKNKEDDTSTIDERRDELDLKYG